MHKKQVIISIVLVLVALTFSAAYAWQQSQNNASAPTDQVSTPTPTPTTSTQSPTPTNTSQNGAGDGAQAVEQTVQLYLVALDDGGQSGTEIGCGDSLVPVEETLTTATPLTDAVKALLAIDDQYYGQSGLYHSLWQSNLQLDSAAISNGVATVELNGTLQLSGTCDSPRVQEQLEATITQFESVNSATILLNGQPLGQALSSR